MKGIWFGVVFVFGAFVGVAQEAPVVLGEASAPSDIRRISYSEAEVAAAIEKGRIAKGRSTALSISDAGRGFMNAMATLNSPNAVTAGTGFRLAMYTPLTWVQQQASDAAKVYKPFHPEDVTDDMLRPLLRVVVYPDKATDFRNQAQTSSVEHVVVRDEAKRQVVQPLSMEPFAESTQTIGGAQLHYNGLLVAFDLDEVKALIATPGLDEFFVTVVGEGSKEKNFKIKNKRYEDLPGLR